MLDVAITPADIQDRYGFIPLLKEVRRVFVFLQRIFADGGYSGAKTAAEAKREFRKFRGLSRYITSAEKLNPAGRAVTVHLRRAHRDFHAERPIDRAQETDMLARQCKLQ